LANGSLALLDYIGLDTTLAIAEVLESEIDPKFHPCSLLRQMVRAKLLGRKAFIELLSAQRDK